MKPKIHLLRHLEHDLFTILSNANSHHVLNPMTHGCEMNEDFIGRACRLSRKCSTQLLCQRVLQSILLKADFLNRRWQQFGPRGRSSKAKAAQRTRKFGRRMISIAPKKIFVIFCDEEFLNIINKSVFQCLG